jgi:phosphate starvation-inducible PhoH-like protein
MPDTHTLTLDSRDEAVQLFGPRDAHLRMIRDALAVRLIARGDTVQIDGESDSVEKALRVFEQLRQALRTQSEIKPEDVRTMLAVVQTGNDRAGPQAMGVTDSGKYLRPRTDGQARYVHAMRDNDVVLCVGPAGTGKTYLAVAQAVSMLRQNVIKRIVRCSTRSTT